MTSGNSDGPNTDIKAGKFEVFCADLYHGVGDVAGPLTVTNLFGMESVTYGWNSTYGSMEPDSGSESWLTVTRLPSSQDEKMSVVTTAELDAQSHVAITSIVEQCSQRMFSVNLSTNNFSPQLGETLGIGVTVPGCIHENTAGWLEIEIVREVINATQHVASVDMDVSTSTVDRYLDTSVLGGQSPSFTWDGLAQASLALADHPDIFTGTNGWFHRAMPAVVTGDPVPPPFYTLVVRLWNADKNQIVDMVERTIYIPQVAKISFSESEIDLFKLPILATNDIGVVSLFSGCSSMVGEAALLMLDDFAMQFVPPDVNLRIVDSNQSVEGQYILVNITVLPNTAENTRGESHGWNPRNAQPGGWIQIRIPSFRGSWKDFYLKRQMGMDSFSLPLIETDLIKDIACTIIHEIGHAIGLVDRQYLDSGLGNGCHNRVSTFKKIMDSGGLYFMYDRLHPHPAKYWTDPNKAYLEFILPKAQK